MTDAQTFVYAAGVVGYIILRTYGSPYFTKLQFRLHALLAYLFSLVCAENVAYFILIVFANLQFGVSAICMGVWKVEKL